MDDASAQFPVGARVLVRDEEWLVRRVSLTDHDGYLLRVIGVSEFVQDEEAVFLSKLEDIEVLRPENTTLIRDTTAKFRRSRLYLEAVLRRTPLPRTEKGLALADGLNPAIPSRRRMDGHSKPCAAATSGTKPRLGAPDVLGALSPPG